MRHNSGMRSTLALLVVAACGGPAARSTLPKVETKPGDDLARAQVGATPGTGTATDPRLGTVVAGQPGDNGSVTRGGDPTATGATPAYDLDTIRIGVIGTDAAGDPELEATTPVQWLQEGTVQSEAGHLDAAMAKWRQLVTEFPESKYAAIALWDIAAVQEKQGATVAELATLRELVDHYPQRRESVDAHLYICALQSEHDLFADAAK